ncbi:MAG: raiA [Nocardioidaceae bacterium]|nr:raiA [Nocardioidaceae bacterium]
MPTRVPEALGSFCLSRESDCVDIVVSGRHIEVSDRFRGHVEDKLARLEKHDHRLIRVEVHVEKEPSSKPDQAVRVELTAKSRGPVVRAEALAEDKMAALDLALDKMASQMRRAADRRKAHGQRRPTATRDAFAAPEPLVEPDDEAIEHMVGPVAVTGDGPLVVREKVFEATPVTLEQALYEMELVGHDFYLFVDKESEKPSVVYRRRGYDYGVISLDRT